jgi:hypothetical protein
VFEIWNLKSEIRDPLSKKALKALQNACLQGFLNMFSELTDSRREYMFIGIYELSRFNPEGIICINPALSTYNPFGIK